MEKPTAYAGKPYPFTSLDDREFEELIYNIFKADIASGKYVGRFDDVDILTGVAEQGRDCKLYHNGVITGNIQCKNFETNINKPDFACELIKFLLNYLLDPKLIPDVNHFTYFLVTAKGFSTTTVDLAGEIKSRVDSESDFEKWLIETINKYARFKKANFNADNTKVKIIDLIKSIDIELIHSADLNFMLSTHKETIAAAFFDIQKVIDVEAFRKLLEEFPLTNKLSREDILNYSVDNAIEYARKLTSDIKSSISTNRHDIQSALFRQLREVDNWCGEISFSDLKRAKKTDQVYVELDMYLLPLRKRIELDEVIEMRPLSNIFDHEHRHYILLGQPGAGKTTSMKFICHRLLRDAKFHTGRFGFPLVIRLRDLNTEFATSARFDSSYPVEGFVIRYLYKQLNLNIQFGEGILLPDEIDRKNTVIENIIIRFLDELKVLLILDGFDEITIPKYKDITLREIRKLALKLHDGTLVVTSRTGEFPYDVEKTDQFEICSLTQQQIVQFSRKWLVDDNQVEIFLSEIAKSPFADTTIKPLTLAHLCAIFERTGKIPDKPKTVYRKIINHKT